MVIEQPCPMDNRAFEETRMVDQKTGRSSDAHDNGDGSEKGIVESHFLICQYADLKFFRDRKVSEAFPGHIEKSIETNGCEQEYHHTSKDPCF